MGIFSPVFFLPKFTSHLSLAAMYCTLLSRSHTRKTVSSLSFKLANILHRVRCEFPSGQKPWQQKDTHVVTLLFQMAADMQKYTCIGLYSRI